MIEIQLNSDEKKLFDFINQNQLFDRNENLLLAVSGGIDSMAMMHFLHKLQYNISVAHANFKLRGEESDDEELLVRNICTEKNLRFHSEMFNTRIYARNRKLSLEMAARELRYNWFTDLCNQYGYSKVLIAHNKNDHTETILLNLCRGTSLKGFRGLKPENGIVIRPLICFTRSEIEDYVNKEGIVYLTDSSNKNIKFHRNRVRLKVIPELLKINPSLFNSIFQNSEYLVELENFIDKTLEAEFKRVAKSENNRIFINIGLLEGHELKKQLIKYIFLPFDLSTGQLKQVELLMYSQPGKKLNFAEKEIIRDREFIILQDKKNQDAIWQIEENFTGTIICDNFNLTIDYLNSFPQLNLKNKSFAYLDFKKLKFPLIVRKWRAGDKFIPYGFTNFKLLSDFLTDLKVSSSLKKEIYVVENDGEIVWVINFRIDDRYKIAKNTDTVLQLKTEF